jgi:hypothetical protein
MFRFPNPVDEHAARTVALGVVALSVLVLATGQHWLLLPLAYGFLARVLTGPRLSPLGLLATRVVVPRLPMTPRLVPGPPKRFAQGIGLAFSAAAAVLALGLGLDRAADAVLLALTLAASLEAFAGLCLGCRVFAMLMRLGVIPGAVCEACNDLSARRLAA